MVRFATMPEITITPFFSNRVFRLMARRRVAPARLLLCITLLPNANARYWETGFLALRIRGYTALGSVPGLQKLVLAGAAMTPRSGFVASIPVRTRRMRKGSVQAGADTNSNCAFYRPFVSHHRTQALALEENIYPLSENVF